MKKILILIIILSLFVSGCRRKNKDKKVTETKVEYVGEKEPSWVFNPNEGEKYKFAKYSKFPRLESAECAKINSAFARSS